MKRIALMCALFVLCLTPLSASSSQGNSHKYDCDMMVYMGQSGFVRKLSFHSAVDRSMDLGHVVVTCSPVAD